MTKPVPVFHAEEAAGGSDYGSQFELAGCRRGRSRRRRIVHEMRKRQAWLIVLAILFPVGFADGVAHHAWLPTSAGAGVSLLIIWAIAVEIRRQRKRLSSVRKEGNSV